MAFVFCPHETCMYYRSGTCGTVARREGIPIVCENIASL